MAVVYHGLGLFCYTRPGQPAIIDRTMNSMNYTSKFSQKYQNICQILMQQNNHPKLVSLYQRMVIEEKKKCFRTVKSKLCLYPNGKAVERPAVTQFFEDTYHLFKMVVCTDTVARQTSFDALYVYCCFYVCFCSPVLVMQIPPTPRSSGHKFTAQPGCYKWSSALTQCTGGESCQRQKRHRKQKHECWSGLLAGLRRQPQKPLLPTIFLTNASSVSNKVDKLNLQISINKRILLITDMATQHFTSQI